LGWTSYNNGVLTPLAFTFSTRISEQVKRQTLRLHWRRVFYIQFKFVLMSLHETKHSIRSSPSMANNPIGSGGIAELDCTHN
jgi:hypothetical protein